jgi:hypothetical protein
MEIVRARNDSSHLRLAISWCRMRQNAEYFGQQELVLLYIAKRLKEAQRIEEILNARALEYLVETDTYRGGFLFVSERIGAFFYVTDAANAEARQALSVAGFHPYDTGASSES